MKIIERWREHRGSVDERVEAESNRVYKLGFVMLSFGVLVYLYYDWSLKQATCWRTARGVWNSRRRTCSCTDGSR